MKILGIFILLSIKTRIETELSDLTNPINIKFLSYYPLKQGLKLDTENYSASRYAIFILLSIKTRIETNTIGLLEHSIEGFLSYYPLKQGLKHRLIANLYNIDIKFLSYYPLKQGLKQEE